ncbi:hypothetical protein ACP4OV_002072 [Aristida adscensionis]
MDAPPPASALQGVIRSLPAKLQQLQSEPKHALRKEEKRSIRLLMNLVQELVDKYLMEPSEVEHPASTARCWVKEVRELSYDVDDFVDELAHAGALHLQQNLRGNNIKKLRKGPRIGEEISRFRALVQEAIQRHKMYSLDKCKMRRLPLSLQLSGAEAPRPRLVGMDRSVEKLEEWLTDEGEPHLRVVSVVGLGGVGKTTLANQLYRRLRSRFDCCAFVRSSQKPDFRKLLTSILLQVRRHRPPDAFESLNLIDTIRKHLHHKKYFIIIDGLWASSTWDIVCDALPDDSCCSRILTTTEVEIVAYRCCGRSSNHIYKMEPLNDNDSRELFFSRVSKNQYEHGEQLSEISSEIIKKCGGFPLATIATASYLAGQQDMLEQFNCIRRQLSSNLRTNPTVEGLKQVLDLCYNNLPDRLKACMLYLSVYKEDHIIWKDDLVKLWIAEGFICTKEGKDTEEVARSYFHELVNRGMVQPICMKYNGEVLSCRVHHMVLGLIRYKSMEENFITAIDHSQTNIRLADKVRRLSLHFGDAEDVTPPENLRLSQIRSFFYFGSVNFFPSIANFRLLRVLILHLWGDQYNISFDLATISTLFRLRYVDIVCNVTLDLQSQLQGLQYLETLKINSRVSVVPQDIVRLPSLLHLSLPGDTELPNDIGNMESLQTLGCFDLSINSADNVKSLDKLLNLRDLHLTCSTVLSDNLMKNMGILALVLSKLSKLKFLTLSPAAVSNPNTPDTRDSSNNISSDCLSSVSSPPALLQKIELFPRIFIFSFLPEWIKELRQLNSLKIEVMELSRDNIGMLEGLPALASLTLYVRTTPAERIVFHMKGFPVLKYFKFICSTLCLAFEIGAMPSVRRLKLGFNADGLEQYSLVDAGVVNLTGLEVLSAKIGGAGADVSCRKGLQSALEDAFVKHVNRPLINVHWVNRIFGGYEETSTAAQTEQDHTMEKAEIITEGGSEEQHRTGEKGSTGDIIRQADNRIPLILREYHNEVPYSVEIVEANAYQPQGTQEKGSGEHKQADWRTSMPSEPSSNVQSQGNSSSCTGAIAGGVAAFTGAIAGGVAAGAALLFAIPGIGFAWWRRRKPQELFFDVPAEQDLEVHLGQLKRFSLRELQVATDGFNNKNILGRGGFGKVYKGRLADGSLVAVKRLGERMHGGEQQFQTEVEMISMAVHRNLLRLRGFCITPTERLLVYPYMANGSVASRLRERLPSEPPLGWQTRRAIALGSARGLSYLHDHCDPKIIHRDVKAANILLNEDFEAVVEGFGLAKLMDHKDTHVTTAVRGTIGHIAPEYLSTGRCSEKTDVFGYGVMLLELITGQRAFDLARLADDDDVMLLDWVKGLLKENRLEMLVDPDLQDNYIDFEVVSLIQLALLCTQGSPMKRPKMSEVVRMLEGDGLAERWEECQRVEVVRQEVKQGPHRNSGWIFDSTDNLHAVELSGPR